ncbi:hypothetical protein HHK36_021502 [Tetracentron sinense]|uniref:ENT domain-containing protein n=1 Tax=Tetracentron sinense TaxID=13715 RepID=A0A834YX33_TETSI|nr:hypothetical protein HHK36_021502 [Tetracentron sinense]
MLRQGIGVWVITTIYPVGLRVKELTAQRMNEFPPHCVCHEDQKTLMDATNASKSDIWKACDPPSMFCEFWCVLISAIMRFKKGSKVEVLSKKEVPSGSWRCAEIISGNGHNYSVRYDWDPDTTGEALVERVSRKAIRPCPLPVEGAENWVPGDLVEVFDNMSWKMATVSKVMVGNYILVRLLGSWQEFRVHKSDLRARQSWKDDKWIMVGKGSGNFEDGKSNNLVASMYYQKSSSHVLQTDARMKLRVGDDCFPVENNNTFQESLMVSSRTLKRGSPYCSSQVEAYTGAARKTRAIEREGTRRRMVSVCASPLNEKVDAVASPREMLGEKYMHASFNNKTTGFYEMDLERGKSKGVDEYFLARSLESNDADSTECSVGSCSSTSYNPYKFPLHSLADPNQDMDNHFSDVESFCGREYEVEKCPLPTKEELAAEIHRLELHAYRCTMEALHASGPLSWEQEALVTNLRLTLHISNDEHLMELRNLVSS